MDKKDQIRRLESQRDQIATYLSNLTGEQKGINIMVRRKHLINRMNEISDEIVSLHSHS